MKSLRLLAPAALIAGALFAQQSPQSGEADRARPPKDEQQDKQKPRAGEVRRLESVAWNPVTGELTWVVSKQTPDATSKDTYLIRIDEALMKFEDERRGFDPREAIAVHKLLDLVSRYAVESTIWWEAGQGIKLDEKGNPNLRASRNSRERE
jgi:hypothetical protein